MCRENEECKCRLSQDESLWKIEWLPHNFRLKLFYLFRESGPHPEFSDRRTDRQTDIAVSAEIVVVILILSSESRLESEMSYGSDSSA